MNVVSRRRKPSGRYMALQCRSSIFGRKIKSRVHQSGSYCLEEAGHHTENLEYRQSNKDKPCVYGDR